MLNNLLAGKEKPAMMSPLQLMAILALLALPVIEITLMILVGQQIGFLATVGLLILAAFAGILIIRWQGSSMLLRMFDSVNNGRLGVSSMAESYAIIFAGSLLIVPGFLTDALGLALLVPPLRRLLLGSVLPGMAAPAPNHNDNAADGNKDRRRRWRSPGRAQAEPQPEAQKPGEPVIIEGTFTRLDDDEDRSR
ncbi:FxsA family protein [Hyphomicrobium sp. D-2]|uniref:FxsA family protein n=1 Tax=Hyphomicrobium sp. D-2 TaxID=3041621 RepID=UPI0024540DD4|nr:FxsA family protein [Hyphomicrobium sp. D-2]MDH4983390.1 FxsA family protein [Hyphomicrobium sp. D-2]